MILIITSIGGITYYDLEQYQKAISEYNQAIEINPDDALTYYHRAIAHAKLDNINEARSDFQQVMELSQQQENEELHRRAMEKLEELD
jgi:Flp pilus assembly protein TadD